MNNIDYYLSGKYDIKEVINSLPQWKTYIMKYHSRFFIIKLQLSSLVFVINKLDDNPVSFGVWDNSSNRGAIFSYPVLFNSKVFESNSSLIFIIPMSKLNVFNTTIFDDNPVADKIKTIENNALSILNQLIAQPANNSMDYKSLVLKSVILASELTNNMELIKDKIANT